jgi:hypothetical protein
MAESVSISFSTREATACLSAGCHYGSSQSSLRCHELALDEIDPLHERFVRTRNLRCVRGELLSQCGKAALEIVHTDSYR